MHDEISLAVSSGCPCGIGPEVVVGALAEFLPATPRVRVVVYGDDRALAEAARVRRVDLRALPRVEFRAVSSLEGRVWGAPDERAGEAQLAAVDGALDAVLRREADAIVTAPVSKYAITRSGTPFHGHTEYLAAKAGSARVVMLFAGPRLRTSLVTTHLPIAKVSGAITREKVRESVRMTVQSMLDDFTVVCPRVAVTGLNPHAGEEGLLGDEEAEVIAPAVDEVRALYLDRAEVFGPLAAEAAFRGAKERRFDAVVAMYHDQATIASKLLDFGDAVNVTLGLPFVRTSVDHGTAYDIAGKGRAESRAMRAALDLATKMVMARGPRFGS